MFGVIAESVIAPAAEPAATANTTETAGAGIQSIAMMIFSLFMLLLL